MDQVTLEGPREGAGVIKCPPVLSSPGPELLQRLKHPRRPRLRPSPHPPAAQRLRPVPGHRVPCRASGQLQLLAVRCVSVTINTSDLAWRPGAPALAKASSFSFHPAAPGAHGWEEIGLMAALVLTPAHPPKGMKRRGLWADPLREHWQQLQGRPVCGVRVLL